MRKSPLITSLMAAVILATCGKKGEAVALTVALGASVLVAVAPAAPAVSDAAAAPAVPAVSDTTTIPVASDAVASAPAVKQ